MTHDAFFILLFVVVAGLMTAGLAARKGYNPVIWFFAANIVGLIALAFLPAANAPDLWDSERAERTKRGNIIGGILAGIFFVFGVLRGSGY